MEIRQAMGAPKGRTAGAKYLSAFVEDMKTSGFVADALKRSNQSATVAPRQNDRLPGCRRTACESGTHVRFGSKADMCSARRDVRFTPDCDRKSRHRLTGPMLLSSATEEYESCKTMQTSPYPHLKESP